MAKCPKRNNPITWQKAFYYKNGIICGSCGAKSYIKKDKVTTIYTYFPGFFLFSITLLIGIPILFISPSVKNFQGIIVLLLFFASVWLVHWAILWKKITLEIKNNE